VAPRAPAVQGQDKNGCGGQGTRDRRIQLMAGQERMGWQQVAGHGRRNHAGTAMTRCMHLIGPGCAAEACQRNGARPPSPSPDMTAPAAKPVFVRVA